MVQTAGVFDDSKEFVDRPLKASPEDVLAAFEELLNETNATTAVLTSFVRNWTDEAGSDLLPWQPTDWVERCVRGKGALEMHQTKWNKLLWCRSSSVYRNCNSMIHKINDYTV